MIKLGKLKLTSLFKQVTSESKQVKAYHIAREHFGLREIRGNGHEPKILEFFNAVGHSWVKDDETAWCAAFVGACLEAAGIVSSRRLNARSYLEWGDPVSSPKEGDIVVFWRGSPKAATGHVAFFVKHNDNGDFIVLGGNQSDMVNEQVYAKERVLSIRRYPE
jgi:uncharacterized protein (TIGR02594 family)